VKKACWTQLQCKQVNKKRKLGVIFELLVDRSINIASRSLPVPCFHAQSLLSDRGVALIFFFCLCPIVLTATRPFNPTLLFPRDSHAARRVFGSGNSKNNMKRTQKPHTMHSKQNKPLPLPYPFLRIGYWVRCARIHDKLNQASSPGKNDKKHKKKRQQCHSP